MALVLLDRTAETTTFGGTLRFTDQAVEGMRPFSAHAWAEADMVPILIVKDATHWWLGIAVVYDDDGWVFYPDETAAEMGTITEGTAVTVTAVLTAGALAQLPATVPAPAVTSSMTLSAFMFASGSLVRCVNVPEITLTLPDVDEGWMMRIMRCGTGGVSIAGGSSTINGSAAPVSIPAQWRMVEVYCSGNGHFWLPNA